MEGWGLATACWAASEQRIPHLCGSAAHAQVQISAGKRQLGVPWCLCRPAQSKPGMVLLPGSSTDQASDGVATGVKPVMVLWGCWDAVVGLWGAGMVLLQAPSRRQACARFTVRSCPGRLSGCMAACRLARGHWAAPRHRPSTSHAPHLVPTQASSSVSMRSEAEPLDTAASSSWRMAAAVVALETAPEALLLLPVAAAASLPAGRRSRSVNSCSCLATLSTATSAAVAFAAAGRKLALPLLLQPSTSRMLLPLLPPAPLLLLTARMWATMMGSRLGSTFSASGTA